MQYQLVTIRIALPRNAVLRALVRVLVRAVAGRHTDAQRHRVAADHKDFDQRVREVGEW